MAEVQDIISVDILTPEGSRHFEAEAVFLPGSMGEFEVLRNHAPIISVLTKGEIKWRSGGSMSSLEINGGTVILRNNKMQICVRN